MNDPISTGLSGVDTLLGGGLPRGKVTTLTSQFTMMGKTALAITIAYNAAIISGERVTYLTLEGKNADVADKLMAMGTGLDAIDMRRGTITEDELARVKRVGKGVADAHVYMSDYNKKSVHDIRRDFEQTRPDLLIIDYVDLLSDADRDPAQLLKDIQHTAEEWNAAFLVVTCIHAWWRPLHRHGPLLLLSRQEEQAQLTIINDDQIAQTLLYFYKPSTRFFTDYGECVEAYPDLKNG